MLKWSSEIEINKFCAEICSRFNPKFTGTREEIDAQSELAFATAYSFAKNCELTAEEFFLAFNLAAEGNLKYEEDKDGNSEPIKLFREVDAIKLNEVKSAYIRYKSVNKKYENGKAEIKAFLEPPKFEPTPEERKQSFLQMCRTDYGRLQKEGSVLGTTEFYKYIKANGIETVRISWLESILERFQPESFESGLSVSKVGSMLDMPKKTKHNVKIFFIDNLVKAYFEKEKLKSLSEDEFVEYWENIFEKQSNTKNKVI